MLARPATFAMVGVSPNPVRPSNYVARYLARRGYRLQAVNPGHAGTEMFGAVCVAGLSDLHEAPDVIDIFRRPEAVPAIVDEALSLYPSLRGIWLQIGIVSPESERLCAQAGVAIVQDRCPKIEHQRLFGELRMGGFATGIVSSKLPR
ncbi:CoA-binding protein [Jannaschia aquimarina]|nr:CoA-binding protein [Jannaschia aquimarina]